MHVLLSFLSFRIPFLYSNLLLFKFPFLFFISGDSSPYPFHSLPSIFIPLSLSLPSLSLSLSLFLSLSFSLLVFPFSSPLVSLLLMFVSTTIGAGSGGGGGRWSESWQVIWISYVLHCMANKKKMLFWHDLNHNARPYRGICSYWGLGQNAMNYWKFIAFSLFFLFLWGRRRTLAPAAYSHDSLAKQWPRYCEPSGSKPCRCAILVPFYEVLIPITVSYDLRR